MNDLNACFFLFDVILIKIIIKEKQVYSVLKVLKYIFNLMSCLWRKCRLKLSFLDVVYGHIGHLKLLIFKQPSKCLFKLP